MSSQALCMHIPSPSTEAAIPSPSTGEGQGEGETGTKGRGGSQLITKISEISGSDNSHLTTATYVVI